jgi:hypothetical protein
MIEVSSGNFVWKRVKKFWYRVLIIVYGFILIFYHIMVILCLPLILVYFLWMTLAHLPFDHATFLKYDSINDAYMVDYGLEVKPTRRHYDSTGPFLMSDSAKRRQSTAAGIERFVHHRQSVSGHHFAHMVDSDNALDQFDVHKVDEMKESKEEHASEKQQSKSNKELADGLPQMVEGKGPL